MTKLAWIVSTALISVGCSSGEGERSTNRRHIDIGTHQLEVFIEGDTRRYPTVVIESGLGAKIEDWARVREILSQKTQVVCYNRAGIGGSQPGPEPRDASTVALELREALRALKVEPPFILVGHSIGGIYVRQFAASYPDLVGGVVLLDPTMEFLEPLSKTRIEAQLRECWAQDYDRIESLLRRVHPKMSLMAAQSILELEPYFEQVPIAERRQQRKAWLDLITKRTRQIEGILSVLTRAESQELFASAESMDLVRNKVIKVPLLLLAAGKTVRSSASNNEAKTSDYFIWANKLRTDRYATYVRSQANGRLTIVSNAGHNIHRDQPTVVAKAIEQMLESTATEMTE